MDQSQFLRDVAVLLAAAFPILILARALRLPPVLGFLITGVLIGPNALGLLRDPHSVETIAELGVVLILFYVGLEFPLSRLRGLGKSALLSGTLQVMLTTAAVAVATLPFTDDLGTSIFYGFLAAFSSTAVIVPILMARDELFSPYGSRALGVLLVQDLLVVPIVLMVAILGGGRSITPWSIAGDMTLAFGGVVAIVLISRYLIPLIMERIGRLGEEGFTAGVLILVIAIIYTGDLVGLSAAMGAFVAGIVLAETKYVHKIVGTLRPFRDLFSSIFFASIGMLLNPKFLAAHLNEAILVVVGVLAIKALIAYPALRASGTLPHSAAKAALVLANVGEFSFVLAQEGAPYGLLSSTAQQYFVTAAVLSIALAPLMVRGAHRIASFLPPEGLEDEKGLEREEPLTRHVIVVGYGLNGRSVTRVLSETAIPHIVLEEDPDRAAEALSRGSRSVLADASTPHGLEAAWIHNCVVVVIAISSPEAARRVVRLARQMNDTVRIIVRTRYVSEVETLRAEGADEVIPEEFETSIEIVTRVLRVFHVPQNILAAQLRLLRDETYRILRDPTARVTEGRKLSALLAAGTSETFLILPGSPADGKTLQEIGFGANHVAVPAVIRDGKPLVSPPMDLGIEAGDILLLVGAHEDLNRVLGDLEE